MNKEDEEDFWCARAFIKLLAFNIVVMTILCLPIIFQAAPDCFCFQILFWLPALWMYFISPFVFLLVFLAVPYLFFVLCRSEDRDTGCSLLILTLLVAAINELISLGWLVFLLVEMTSFFG